MIAREQLVKASQGNPGAAVALGTMAQAGLHETIQKILDYGLRGTDIYVLFSDICEKDPQKVMDVVDSVPKDLLIEAASKQDRSGRQMIISYFFNEKLDGKD